jgi:AAA domain
MSDPISLEGKSHERRAHPPKLAVINSAPPPESEDDYGVVAKSPATPEAPPKFKVERWSEIKFEANEEWLIKGVLPRRGLAAIYGKPKAFKSFVALHVSLCVSLGHPWAGRRVEQVPVAYIAAEGAAGLRKRKAGYVKSWHDLPADVPFALIPAAPNLGSETGDLPELVARFNQFERF